MPRGGIFYAIVILMKAKQTTKQVKKQAKKQSPKASDILVQVGLVIYFTAYFIAHHFLGAYNTRWIFYAGIAALVLYTIKTKTKKEQKFAEGFCFYKALIPYCL